MVSQKPKGGKRERLGCLLPQILLHWAALTVSAISPERPQLLLGSLFLQLNLFYRVTGDSLFTCLLRTMQWYGSLCLTLGCFVDVPDPCLDFVRNPFIFYVTPFEGTNLFPVRT